MAKLTYSISNGHCVIDKGFGYSLADIKREWMEQDRTARQSLILNVRNSNRTIIYTSPIGKAGIQDMRDFKLEYRFNGNWYQLMIGTKAACEKYAKTSSSCTSGYQIKEVK